MRELESGRVGEWESGRVGEWESGRVVEWESGRAGAWESGRCRPSAPGDAPDFEKCSCYLARS